MRDIASQYKMENPNWTWRQCWEKARYIYRELNRLNANMARNNSTFFKMNTPFSFYESEDGTWSSIPELEDI